MKDAMTDHKAEWVLVPRVATEAMCSKFWDHAELGRDGWVDLPRAYAAMIAAAPAASECAGDVCGLAKSTGVICAAGECDRINGVRPDPAASEGEDGPSYRTCRCNTGFVHQEKDCPAAQVAATPKHDEGVKALWRGWRHEFDGGETECFDEPDTGCKKCYPVVLISASDFDALATQPAARRVTDEALCDALKAYNRAANRWHKLDLDSRDEPRSLVAMRAALESFAQPAEGVSGG